MNFERFLPYPEFLAAPAVNASKSITSLIFELENLKDSYVNPRPNVGILAVNFE